MKKLIFAGIFLCLTGGAVVSCKKDNRQNFNSEYGVKEVSFTKEIEVENGTLVFENEAHLLSELEKISKLTIEEKIIYENKFGFRSLGTIEQLINKAEIEHQDEFFQGIDPNLSVKEYEAMGLFYKNTDIFTKYLNKKIIKVNYEKDSSYSFELTVKSPGFIYVLNEAGEVIVGEKLFKFHDSYLTISNKATNQVIKIINFSETIEKMTSNWSQGGAWVYDGTSKRYNYQVYGASITSSNETPGGLIDAVFYVQAIGQEKKFGSWAGRSSYLPVYSFTGSWTANYTAQQCFTCSIQTNPFALNDSDFTSPYSWSSVSGGGQTNNFLRYLKPNGSWALPTPWLVVSAFNVNYNMTFNFSGGSSGFSHTLIK